MDFAFERLHHVQLLIPPGGEGDARAFYAGVLGMTELTKPPVLAARGGCWFRGGGWEVHLAPVPEAPGFSAPSVGPGAGSGTVPERKAHPGVLVTGLDLLAAALEAAGHPVEWDPHFPGHRRLYAQDAHGNRLEFLEPRITD